MYSQLVSIRVDASSSIGLGHLIRCISLAHMLKEKFSIRFVLGSESSSYIDLTRSHGFDVLLVKSELEFLNLIQQGEIVVLDGYHFETEFQKSIVDRNAKLVCIDDLHDKSFWADMIINHAPGVRSSVYSVEKTDVSFLLGPEFALLRPEFLTERKVSLTLNNVPQKILICFGGSDFQNLTYSLIDWCNFGGSEEYTIIVGSAYPYLDKLVKFIEQSPKSIRLLKSLDEREMKAELESTELAIVPASGILFEAISCGVPVISGFYTENQYDIYRGFLDLKVIYGAENFSREAVESAFERISLKASEQLVIHQRNCFDGQSPARILKEFTEL